MIGKSNISFLALVIASSWGAWCNANPTNPNENGLLDVESATILGSSSPNSTDIEILFNRSVVLPNANGTASFGVAKVQLNQPTFGNSVLEDLNGDGFEDLVVADGMEVRAHLNDGSSQEMAFAGNSSVLATRSPTTEFDPVKPLPLPHFESAVTFGDADNDGDRDLIVGERWHGNVVYFPCIAPANNGQPRQFGAQRVFKWESASNGSLQDIATAKADGANSYDLVTQFYGMLDLDLASPALIKYDGDDNYDLIVVDSNPYSNVQPEYVEVVAYNFKRRDEANGGVPIYGQKEVVGSYWFSSYQMEGTVTLSVSDIDGLNGPDIVLSLDNGKVFVAKNTGSRSSSGNMQFSPPVVLIQKPATVQYHKPRYSIVPSVDNPGTGVNLMISKEEISSGRRRRIERAVIPRTSTIVSRPMPSGAILGAEAAISMNVANLEEDMSNFQMADFNGDKNYDIFRSNLDGTFSIAFSADTGDDFNPDYVDWAQCVDDAGVPVSLGQMRFSLLKTGEQEKPEAIVGIVNRGSSFPSKIYTSQIEGVDGSGRPILGAPNEIHFPTGIAGQTTGSLSIALDDFHPADAVRQPTGAYFTRQSYTYNDVNAGLQVYWAPLITLAPFSFAPATFLWRDPYGEMDTDPEKNKIPPTPYSLDLDADGDLDLVLYGSCGEGLRGRVRWFKNTAGAGATPQLVFQGYIDDQVGGSLYAPGGSPGVFCGFRHPKSSRMLVLSALSSSQSTLLGSTWKTGVFELVPSGSTLRLAPAAESAARIRQTLAGNVSQESLERIQMRVPLGLLPGESIAINQILRRNLKISFESADIVGNDNDGDGLSYDWEMAHGYNPNSTDSDLDGILDRDEDYDGDGLLNKDELIMGTDLTDIDSDDDGILDGADATPTTFNAVSQPSVGSIIVLTPLK